jgi:hypothetical protein
VTVEDAGSRTGSAALSLLASSRSALRVVVLLPVWLWLWAVEAALSRHDPLPGQVFSAWLLAAAGLLVWAWAAHDGVRTARDGEAPLLASRVRALGCGARRILLVPLVAFFPGAFALLVAAAGTAALPLVPVVGGWLASAWVVTAGLVLSLLAATWTLIAIISLPLAVAASVAEEEASPMEVFTWATHAARSRLLHVAGGWLLVLAGTAAGAVLYLAFFILAASFLVALDAMAGGSLPSAASLEPWWSLALSPRAWIPGAGPLGLPGAGSPGSPGAGSLPGAAAAFFPHAARLLPAFILASLFAGGGRLHVALRGERPVR